jgi:hypothetical protein
MTDGESSDILSRVETLLGGRELQDPPRALLLLELCKFSMRLAPDKTERYWQLLHPLQSKLPPELQAEFKELRGRLEEAAASGAKGFTGEMLAEIRAAAQATDAAETRRRLLDCEARLKKRLLPRGKGPVWVALVQAWIPLDRAYALQLLKSAPGGLHKDLITQMNRARALAPEEWTTLAEGIGMGKVQQIVPAILDDNQQALRLPRAALTQVAKELRSALQRLVATGNQVEAAATVHRYDRLLQLHASGEAAELLPGLLEELFAYIAKDAPLDQAWLLRFTLLQGVIDNGVRLKTPAGAVMTPALIERLVSKTPGHMVSFVRAQCAGLMATAEQAETASAGLMATTNQDERAEAWFLVALVQRGLGHSAAEFIRACGAGTSVGSPRPGSSACASQQRSIDTPSECARIGGETLCLTRQIHPRLRRRHECRQSAAARWRGSLQRPMQHTAQRVRCAPSRSLGSRRSLALRGASAHGLCHCSGRR